MKRAWITAVVLAMLAFTPPVQAAPPGPWPPQSVDYGNCTISDPTWITKDEAECILATRGGLFPQYADYCNLWYLANGSAMKNFDTTIQNWGFGCSMPYHIGNTAFTRVSDQTLVINTNTFRPAQRISCTYGGRVHEYLSGGYSAFSVSQQALGWCGGY
jgi:hypothetical protein